MNHNSASVADGIRAMIAAKNSASTEHPSTEDLCNYSRNALTEEADERIRKHIALCSDCAGMVLEFAEFSPLPAKEPTQVAIIEESSEPASEAEVSSKKHLLSRPSFAWATAAAFLLLALFVPSFQARRLPLPLLNEVAIALDPPSRSTNLQEIVVPRRSERFLLLWTPTKIPNSGEYKLEIQVVGASAPLSFTEFGLFAHSGGTFSVSFSKRFFPPGHYRLTLTSTQNSSSQKFAEREVFIRYE